MGAVMGVFGGHFNEFDILVGRFVTAITGTGYVEMHRMRACFFNADLDVLRPVQRRSSSCTFRSN